MIQVLVKSKNSWAISLRNLIDIGDVVIYKDRSIRCKSSTGGGNLLIQGKLLDTLELIELTNVELNGNDREYEENWKNLCAWSQGEVKASVILNGGEGIFRFSSINGEMTEEEIEI